MTADYEGVCHNMRLASGVLWPIPITLDVTEEFAKKLTPGTSKVALRDGEGVMLAVLHVEEVWQADRSAEAKAVFNTTSKAHPGANYTMNLSNPWYVGGRVEGQQGPSHYDFRTLRLTQQMPRRGCRPHGLAARRSVPDPQSYAPGARGTNVPRRRNKSKPTCSSTPAWAQRPEARRRGLFHPRPLLPVVVRRNSHKEP